ncbi:MAG: LytR/AlgR family response regulator transcription factor [Flavobacteriaceae bacterium]
MERILIVDDEKIAHRVIERLLEQVPGFQFEIVGRVTSVRQALEILKENEVDLVFLDINMPEQSGFDLIETLGSAVEFEIIFTTAYDQFAIQAIKNNALDYLLKPINPNEFYGAIQRYQDRHAKGFNDKLNRLLQEVHSPPRRFKVHSVDGIEFVDYDDILYFSADGSYSKVHLKGGPIKSLTKNLKALEIEVPPNLFFRIHKSYLVNLKEVKKYIKSDKNIELSNGDLLGVAHRKEDEFIKALH